MRNPTHLLLTLLLAGLLPACGSEKPSDAEAGSEKASSTEVKEAQPVDNATHAEPGQQVVQGLQQVAKGLQQLATSPQNASVKPVHFRELKKLFQPFSGWTLSDTSGQMLNMPVPFSQAEGTYTKGDSRIEVSITDSAMNQVVLAPVTMLMASGFERETDTGYERSITLNGNPGWEKWHSDTKSGELTVLVNKRFLLKLDGTQVANLEPLKKLAAQFDFSKVDTSHTQSAPAATTK